MSVWVLTIFCLGMTVLLAALERAYFWLPVSELKRNFSHDQPIYRQIYAVAKFGGWARAIFKFLTLFFAISAVILLGRELRFSHALFAALLIALYLRTYGARSHPFGENMAGSLSPYLAKFFLKLEKPAHTVMKLLKLDRKNPYTEIYSKEDLIAFLDRQRKAPNNRIEEADLAYLVHGLSGQDRLVKDFMTKRKDVHFVTPKDSIGPILLSELHRTGHSCFPVKGNSDNEVLGMLNLEQLEGFKEGGKVADAMSSGVYYVNENKTLSHVMQAFTKTGRYVFLVVNNEAKITGLISVSDALEELVGESIYSEFEEYAEKSAVADL